MLQNRLKCLTKTSDWLGDPILREEVNDIRSELYPKNFKKKNLFNYNDHVEL